MPDSWPFQSYRDALAFCDDILSRPPRGRHVTRVEPVGELVVRFVMPLEVCPTTNTTRHGSRWAANKRMCQLRGWMSIQAAAQGWRRRNGPLPGRPQVRCIRFSTRRTDPFSDWAKGPVDMLTGKNRGLNLIVDDSEIHCQLSQKCEPSGKRGVGCVLLEVFSGQEYRHFSQQKSEEA